MIQPYYQQDGITIYHGDCRDIIDQWEGLRTQSFDLLLTDPPYGIGRDHQNGQPLGMAGGAGHRKSYERISRWDADVVEPELICRLRNICQHHIIWGGNYYAAILPIRMKWLVWDKGQRIDQSDGELAWTSFDSALRIFTLSRAFLNIDGAVHPTQKPEALMQWCLAQTPEPYRTVLDAFMGSGTTLIAAKRLGKQATGIEREERYCEIAAKRLSQGVLSEMFV